MSEVKLNLIDTQQILQGTIHGSIADACVAALSAEPETIAELESALERYIKRTDGIGPFASFRRGVEVDTKPWDAGVVIIDLKSRTVAAESSYSQPHPEGQVRYHDGTQSTDIVVLYRVPEDWEFLNSLAQYESRRVRRHKERATDTPIDARTVLYGRALLEFIVTNVRQTSDSREDDNSPVEPSNFSLSNTTTASKLCRSTPAESSFPLTGRGLRGGFYGDGALDPFPSPTRRGVRGEGSYGVGPSPLSLPGGDENPGLGPGGTQTVNSESAGEEALLAQASEIHARWLITPREDLRGQSPRDVLLAKQDFIDFDLHARELQWSQQGEGPPSLSQESLAYRFAGFGTHECVVYYDLVRHLIWSALTCQRFGSGDLSPQIADVPPAIYSPLHERGWILTGSDSDHIDAAVARLEEIKTDWLESPQSDFSGRTPANIIENERRRLPFALSPREMIIDDDCYTCVMMANDPTMGPGFWHLDGSHMDDDFAFSFFRTREEWEAENRRREEFDREFNRRWEERQQRLARGEPVEDEFNLDWVDAFRSESADSEAEIDDDVSNEIC